MKYKLDKRKTYLSLIISYLGKSEREPIIRGIHNYGYYNIDKMDSILSGKIYQLPKNIVKPKDIEKWLMSL